MEIANDIMNNNGLELKKFIQDILLRKNEIVKFNIGDKSVVLRNSKEIKQVDPIQEAITRIEQSPNRFLKRKILHQYNLFAENLR